MNIIMGGWNSCSYEKVEKGEEVKFVPTPVGTDLHKKFLTKSAPGQISIQDYPQIIACQDSGGNIHYFDSDEPEKVKTTNNEGFKDVVEKFYKEKKEDKSVDKLNLTGHSHGGWLAMYLATNLDEDIEINNLFTIDPISKILCTSSNYTKGIFGKIDPNCQSYPKDFGAKGIEKIKKRVGYWKNYWQDETTKLHSSAIPGIENEKFSRSHTQIDNSARVWNQVINKLSDDANANDPCLKNPFLTVTGTFFLLQYPAVTLLTQGVEKLAHIAVGNKHDPNNIRLLNEYLARGEFDKVEEFIEKHPDILDEKVVDPLAVLNLGLFFEQRAKAKEDEKMKEALKWYSKAGEDGKLIAIDKIIGICEAQSENCVSLASLEYWQEKRAIQVRLDREREEAKKPPKKNFIKGLFK